MERNKVLMGFVLSIGLLLSNSLQAMRMNVGYGKEIDALSIALKGFVAVGLTRMFPAQAVALASVTWMTFFFNKFIEEINENYNHRLFVSDTLAKDIAYASSLGLNMTEFPEKITERIEALINVRFENKGDSFEMFPTNKSKIFILQNIEDFFWFENKPEYKKFNLLVHEACIKQIKKLMEAQQLLEKKDEADVSKKTFNEIDAARDKYMAENDISLITLKDMNNNELYAKINQIKKYIELLLMNAARQRSEETEKTKETENSRFQALISIFAHLLYKQSKKQRSMFVGEGLEEAKEKFAESTAIPVSKPAIPVSKPAIPVSKPQSFMMRMRTKLQEWNNWWNNRK